MVSPYLFGTLTNLVGDTGYRCQALDDGELCHNASRVGFSEIVENGALALLPTS